jgi:hypothetical protein
MMTDQQMLDMEGNVFKPKAIDQEDVWELADLLYWQVLDVLGIEDKCVMDNPDDEGTRNTELGEELYNTIENSIQVWGENTHASH